MSNLDTNTNAIKDRALHIVVVEDFADQTNIILVDGVLYRYREYV